MGLRALTMVQIFLQSNVCLQSQGCRAYRPASKCIHTTGWERRSASKSSWSQGFSSPLLIIRQCCLKNNHLFHHLFHCPYPSLLQITHVLKLLPSLCHHGLHSYHAFDRKHELHLTSISKSQRHFLSLHQMRNTPFFTCK